MFTILVLIDFLDGARVDLSVLFLAGVMDMVLGLWMWSLSG